MAINTEFKRMSMLNFSEGCNIYSPLDGGICFPVRRYFWLDLYGGIEPASRTTRGGGGQGGRRLGKIPPRLGARK